MIEWRTVPIRRGSPLPTYEYHCPKCKATYELRQGFDAETTQKCEECGKGIAKRVLHAPPVVFKGSGWYITDSKSRSAAVNDSKTDGESTAATPDATAKSEAKAKSEPATKAEPAAKPASSGGSSEAAAAS